MSKARINVEKYMVLAVLTWTTVIGILLSLILYQDKQSTLELAEVQARSLLERDLAYRRWNAGYGGVYVPITKDSPPNPYLTVPNRDVTSTNGIQLTLINPAYMTRQVHKISLEYYGDYGHITSLNPIRPQNASDAWETKALELFENGAKEMVSLDTINRVPYLRLMVPLFVEEGCLKCHAQQGYKVGDIRGGLDVSVPMAPYLASYDSTAWKTAFGYGFLWILGIAGIVASGRRFGKQMKAQMQVEETLQRNQVLLTETGKMAKVGGWEIDLASRTLTWTEEVYRIHDVEAGFQPTVETAIDFYAPESKPIIEQAVQAAIEHGKPFDVELQIVTAKGNLRWVHAFGRAKNNKVFGAFQDITERKQAEVRLHNQNELLEALHSVALDIGGQMDMPQLLEKGMARAAKILHADRGGGIYLYDANEKVLRLVEVSGINSDRVGITVPIGQGVAGRVYESGQALIINDYTHWEGRLTVLVDQPPSSVLGVPLILEGCTIGSLNLFDDSSLRPFDQTDVELARMFAALFTVAIRNVQLYEQAQREITERKQIEEVLRASEEHYRRLIELLPNGVVVHQQGRIMFVNQAGAQIFSASNPDQLVGMPLMDRVHPDYRDLVRQRIKNSSEQNRQSDLVEEKLLRMDGTAFDAEVTGLPISFAGGPAMLAVFNDITKRRRAEEALINAKDFAENLIQTANVIFVQLNTRGEVIRLNQAAEKIIGYAQSEIVGRNWFETLVPRDRYPYVWEEFVRITELGTFPKIFENPIITRAGEERHIVWQNSVLRQADEIVGTISFGIDITKRKQAEEREREQHALAEAMSDSAAALNSTLKFDDVLDRIMDNVGRVVPHDSVGILLLDVTRQFALATAYRDTRDQPTDMKGTQFSISQTRTLREMLEAGAPLIVTDTSAYDGWIITPSSTWIRAFLGAPIMIKGEIIGFLCLTSATLNAFTPLDADRLQAFVNHAAIAIENARLYEEVQKLALTDVLTGVYNRTFFETELARMEVGRDFPVGIIVIDLDNMKVTNDTLGHSAGDELLKRTTQVLRATFRAADIIARIGGDEFAILLPRTDTTTMEQMLSRVYAKLAEHNVAYPYLPLHVSLGTATAGQGELLAEVFMLADQRMYANKAARKSFQ